MTHSKHSAQKKIAVFCLLLWFGSALVFFKSHLNHHLELSLQSPSLLHPLGCDAFGRDLLVMVLQSSFTSAAFALGAVLVSTVLAIIISTPFCFAPRSLRFAFLRVLESLLAFPSLLFALAYAAARGPGWDTLSFALLIGTLPSFTRLIHLRTLELLAQDYTIAAQSLGAGPWLTFRNHLWPALMSLCKVKIPNLFAHALLAEATLSFLGVGAPIGSNTWGSLLSQGKDYLLEHPHIALGSGIPLVFTLIWVQFLTELEITPNSKT